MYAVTSIRLVRRTLATFRSAEFGFFGVVVLTTVHTPLDRIGEEGAAMLLKLMRHEAVPERCIDVGYTVVVRQST